MLAKIAYYAKLLDKLCLWTEGLSFAKRAVKARKEVNYNDRFIKQLGRTWI